MKKRYLWLVRRSLKAIRHKRLRHRTWWQKLTAPLSNRHLWRPSRDGVAVGLAIGMFFAVMPMPGQALVAALLAMRCGANVPFAVGACFLSNPFTMVPIWTAQLWIGNFVVDNLPVPIPPVLAGMEARLPGMGAINAGNFVVGSVVTGCLLGIGAFTFIQLLAKMAPKLLPRVSGRHLSKRIVAPTTT